MKKKTARMPNKRNRKTLRRDTVQPSIYEALESRQVLASLFPTYIDGQFTLGNGPGAATPYDLADTFELASNPTATKTIYLDFNGHYSVNNQWGHDIVFPAFNREGSESTFSDAELLEIQLQFQNVAEDFLPFDVNVTTKDPGAEALIRSDSNDEFYGVRSVNTQATNGFGNGIGGVAYLNSFDNSRDDPVFAFNKGENNGALTNSHEIGHALGLSHDGLGGSTYHPGTGSGETSWGPIMGAPFGVNLSQWSNGDYANSTQTQNDYSIITSDANGFDFREDQVGDSFGAAADLIPATDGSVFSWSIIEQKTDVDMYTFETGGDVSFSINAFQERPNLDILAKIYDSSGNVVADSNPVDGVVASFNLTLDAGRYYLSIEGIGKAGVYSDYGSIGLYTLDGTIEANDGGGFEENLINVGETGRLSVTQRWQTVTLNHTYENPVVIAGPATLQGADPLTVRVRNVSSNSFQIQLDKWDYLSGRTPFETVDYMVVEAGEHTLSDGSVLVAGILDDQSDNWLNHDLGNAFAEGNRPIVFSQIMTANDSSAATTRMRFITDSEFELKISEQESNNQSHGAEIVGFIAIQAGIGTTGDLAFDALMTPNSVTHNNYDLDFGVAFAEVPAFFANMQTFDGSDTATVRYRNLDDGSVRFFVEEERSNDNEINHTTEVVGALAIEFGDIMAQDLGVVDPPDEPSGPLGFPGFSFLASTPEDSLLWKAVATQQSWVEMTLSISQHDAEFDRLDHLSVRTELGLISKSLFSQVSAQIRVSLEFAKQAETNAASLFSNTSGANVNQAYSQLAGAIEGEPTVSLDVTSVSGLSESNTIETDVIDNVFEFGFDLLS